MLPFAENYYIYILYYIYYYILYTYIIPIFFNPFQNANLHHNVCTNMNCLTTSYFTLKDLKTN